ncbi:MAG: hypothetical protein FJ006_07955 [Chloroflexi bacterium]|nr:hypothetical protein [Chloroflexota bacterium]
MNTLIAVLILAILGVAMNFLGVFILNLAGLPGALLAGKPGKRSKWRFTFGSIVSAIGQSYIYLAYTALIIGGTMLAISKYGVVSFIIWPIAFLAVVLPIWFNLIHARVEAKELEYGNPQTEALHITTFLTLIGFFIFVFIPKVMEFMYKWIPFIGS